MTSYRKTKNETHARHARIYYLLSQVDQSPKLEQSQKGFIYEAVSGYLKDVIEFIEEQVDDKKRSPKNSN